MSSSFSTEKESLPFELFKINISGASEDELSEMSEELGLALSVKDMKRCKEHFSEREEGDPTDLELQTVGQTWSEHCKHKIFNARIHYQDKEKAISALKKKDRLEYLDWAVKAFRLASSGVKDDTQIHTHMCYSEFNNIMKNIAELDADVITIEASRSQMELLEAFGDYEYPNEIGPGVYDIHSPRIPSQEEVEDLLNKAGRVISRKNLWVNPDCGLKTRNWEETWTSLQNMVEAAKSLRNKKEKATP